jgi:hypothetical protein
MEDPFSSNRKRPRSTSPGPHHHHYPIPRIGGTTQTPTALVADNNDDGSDASYASRIVSDDASKRNEALNDLLKVTSSHEINYALEGDEILKALVTVFYNVIGWDPATIHPTTTINDGEDDNHKKKDDDDEEEELDFSAKNAWLKHITPECEEWAMYCQSALAKNNLSAEDFKLLEVIVIVLRNLSFVAANLRLMAYSPDVLTVLVGCLYEKSSKLVGALEDNNNNATNLALNALSVLMNLSPHIDVTGQKLFCDKLFLNSVPPETPFDEGSKLPNPAAFGQVTDASWGFGSMYLAKKLDTKDDIVMDIPKEMLLQLTQDYLVRVWSIFPAIGKVLTDTLAPKVVTMTAIELLQEFINQARVGVVGTVEDQEDSEEIPNLRAILVFIPDNILQRLADFLYIPRLSSDSLEYNDPTINIVTRVNPVRLLGGYDASIDTDVRDRTLEVLVPLLELDSPGMAKRLGTRANGQIKTRVFDAIVPILAAQSGRNEAPVSASHLLRELSKAEENKEGFIYIQERIIALASKDPRVAHLAFNNLYAKEDE